MSSNPPHQSSNAPGKAFKVNEYRLTIQALTTYQHLNRRQLSRITKLEIPTLCRVLFDLVHKKNLVRIAFTGKCPITKKWVYYYTLSKQEGSSDGK
jgi:hypothetical protein